MKIEIKIEHYDSHRIKLIIGFIFGYTFRSVNANMLRKYVKSHIKHLYYYKHYEAHQKNTAHFYNKAFDA